MARFLQLALWNANSLAQHEEELKTFFSIHNIGVMLSTEMHFTEKKLSKISQLCSLPYEPSSRTARGGTAIIIKNTVKHHQLNNYNQDFLQATSLSVEDLVGLLTISAVYLPPKYTVK
jgi:hypothetical protein